MALIAGGQHLHRLSPPLSSHDFARLACRLESLYGLLTPAIEHQSFERPENRKRLSTDGRSADFVRTCLHQPQHNDWSVISSVNWILKPPSSYLCICTLAATVVGARSKSQGGGCVVGSPATHSKPLSELRLMGNTCSLRYIWI